MAKALPYIYTQTYDKLIKAGADERTAKEYGRQAYSDYVQEQAALRMRGGRGRDPFSRASSLVSRATGGAAGTDYVQQFKDAQRSAVDTAQQKAAETEKKVTTEVQVQPALQEIKRKRQSLVEMEAKALTRKTGRRALLTSPPGGGGFFGGYFNGR